MAFISGAYKVDERRARSTAAVIAFFDTKHVDNTFGDGPRWAIQCEHGPSLRFVKQIEAYDAGAKPQDWCADCSRLHESGERINVVPKRVQEAKRVRAAVAERREAETPRAPIPTLDNVPVEELRGHQWERAGKCSKCFGTLKAADNVYHSVVTRGGVTEAACCACVGCSGQHKGRI